MKYQFIHLEEHLVRGKVHIPLKFITTADKSPVALPVREIMPAAVDSLKKRITPSSIDEVRIYISRFFNCRVCLVFTSVCVMGIKGAESFHACWSIHRIFSGVALPSS